MTISVDKEMRERIDAKKIDMKKENYIYESPDGGKTIYRSEIYDDVSGVKIDASEQLKLQFDEFEADKKAINTLSKRVLELEEMIDKERRFIDPVKETIIHQGGEDLIESQIKMINESLEALNILKANQK